MDHLCSSADVQFATKPELAQWASQEQEMWLQQYKLDNHPRENVSWFQAVAFCRWLSAKLPENGWPQGSIPVGDDWQIRLPTEWEWQQAATGGQHENEYPWDKDWDDRRANTDEAGLARTTAVGMYPQGASLVGTLDMSGNVWEWCLNDYFNPRVTDVRIKNRWTLLIKIDGRCLSKNGGRCVVARFASICTMPSASIATVTSQTSRILVTVFGYVVVCH